MVSILTISLLSSSKTNFEKSEFFNDENHLEIAQENETIDLEWKNFKLIANNSISINDYNIEELKNKLKRTNHQLNCLFTNCIDQ